MIARDVTAERRAIRDSGARRETEVALKYSKEMFELAFSAAPIGMALFDLEGRWLRVNPALGALLGRDRDSLLAGSLPAITHPEDREADRRLRRQAVEEGRGSYRVELRFLHADGHTVRARLCVSLVRNDDGSPRWFVGQFEAPCPE